MITMITMIMNKLARHEEPHRHDAGRPLPA